MSEQTPEIAGFDMRESLWEVPETFIDDEDLRTLHTDILRQLRRENPQADTLELLLMERVATGFVYMRSREASGLIGTNDYKTLTQLWITMAADLRKTRTHATDLAAVRDEVVRDFLSAFEDSLKGLDIDTQVIMRKRMAESLQSAA